MDAPVSAFDAFSRCLTFTVGPGPESGGEEGGYVNDPQDPGGITNRGMTLAEMARWLGRPITDAEMLALTRDDVLPVYQAHYWQAARCWALPAGIDLMVFDHAVNRGIGATARALQTAVGVKVDLQIGPLTCLAARGADRAALIGQLHDLQMTQYQALAQWPRYGRDWGGRCDRRRDAALLMTT